MKKILALSTACHKSVNREVYRIIEAKGFEVVIIIPESSYFNNSLVPADPIHKDDPKIIFDKIDTRYPRLNSFKNIRKTIFSEKPDYILIDNDPGSLIVLKCAIFSKMINSKIYCITCENFSINFKELLKRKGVRSILNSLFTSIMLSLSKRLVDVVFTINKDGTDIYKKYGFNLVKQIPLGFDKKLFFIDKHQKKIIREKFNVHDFLLGFLGRNIPEKGLEVLIKALARIKEKKWFLILDEFKEYSSNYAEEINNLIIKKGLKDKIIFINPSHEEMGAYLNAIDILVVPSLETYFWKEQYGRVAAEALACGKKIIYSNTGHLPCLIGENGISFNEGDFNKLSEIITNEINNKDIQDDLEIIRASYSQDNLSAEIQADEMIEMF